MVVLQTQQSQSCIGNDTVVNNVSTSTVNEEQPAPTGQDDLPLSNDVLKLLGERPIGNRVFAAPLHPEYTVRLQDGVKVGLKPEERLAIVAEFPLPSNCLFLDPPKVNVEVAPTMKDAARLRDNRVVSKQQRLAALMAIVGKMTNRLLSAQKSPVEEVLNESLKAGRLVTDMIREESMVRRSLIVSTLNPEVKETLTNTEPDEYLFGAELTEKLKQAKSISQTVAEFIGVKAASSSKNYHPPPRRQPPPVQPLGGQKSSYRPWYRPSNRSSTSQKPRHSKNQSSRQTEARRPDHRQSHNKYSSKKR